MNPRHLRVSSAVICICGWFFAVKGFTIGTPLDTIIGVAYLTTSNVWRLEAKDLEEVEDDED
jgi:hypothetical protein